MCGFKLFLLSFVIISFSTQAFSQSADTMFLYYGINEYALNDADRENIDMLFNNDAVENVSIYAYTDFLGSPEFNVELSNKRSQYVKNYLLSIDFPAKEIKFCQGKGVYAGSSVETKTDKTDRGISNHRLVKIIYHHKPEVSPVEDISEEKDVETIIPNEIVNDQTTEELEVIPMFSNLTDENLIVGENIVLDNILFEGGTPTFKPESEMALKQLYLAMKNHPTLIVEIQGHICCQGDGEDGWDRINKNQNLSSNRAQAVYDYLIEAGIDKDRMTYVGLGSSHKLYPEERNAHEEDMNRRVEIQIVDK